MNILTVDFRTRQVIKVVEGKSQDHHSQDEENIAAFLDTMKATLSHEEYIMVLEAISSTAHYRDLVASHPHLIALVDDYFKLFGD
jgi:hypothetical protein